MRDYAEQVAGPLRDQLGQCFRLSGADPDGNENWRLAPRAVDAVRQLRQDYDEACDEAEKLRQRIAELEGEVERQREIAADAVAGGTRILDIAIENGGLSLSLEGGGAQLLAEILAKQYADSEAVNYLQLSFTSQHSAPGEAFVVTVQRVAGKTAHELRAEAEADRDRLRAECEALRADAERYRWLEKPGSASVYIHTGPHLSTTHACKERMRAAIDAARAAREGK
jgi:cell division septum initiation protein DivIVA